jgi:hypothetical protein
MDVTEKYKNMLAAFTCDFQLAVEEDSNFSIDKLITENSKDIIADIDLLAELEFKIRYGKITIIEKEEEQNDNTI